MKGAAGIGHTRWATHGEPSDDNAHPHGDAAGRIAIVHNGIIENAAGLRAKLAGDGIAFASETDSEVLAHLIAASPAPSLLEAVRLALGQVDGTYGLAVMDDRHPQTIVVARNGSPVILGIGDTGRCSSPRTLPALVRYTQQVVYLDDGEVAEITPGGYRVVTLNADPATKPAATITWSARGLREG